MRKANITLNLEAFRSSKSRIAKYLNMDRVKYYKNQEIEFNHSLFESIDHRRFGVGISEGDPHLVLLNTLDQYLVLVEKFGLDKRNNNKAILNNLKFLVSVFGNYFTFNKRLFPYGISFNTGLIKDGVVYMATHGRNSSSSKGMCRYQQIMTGYCKCLFPISNTGGAVMAYFVSNTGDTKTKKIKTVHQGGEIMYRVLGGTVITRTKRLSGKLTISATI